jgi:lipooligosaccharide transport system ATP-binding protein
VGLAAVQAKGLVKSYGGRRVVDGIDLSCPARSVLGLLGPNGAGKTTALRMLYGFIEPEAGEIHYEGRDFHSERTALKRIIGVCTQDDTLDPDFTVRQNLRVYSLYFRPRIEGIDARVEELLERFDLLGYANHNPEQLSGGYRKRLLIARSIVHRPRILFLDEPTTGLDPKARVELWELIDGMRQSGMAIILTTHYMDEAERLSDDLLVLSRGRTLAQGTPRRVIGSLLGEHVVVVPPDEPRREDIQRWSREREVVPALILRELRVPLSPAMLAEFSERFGDARFEVRTPSLDDLFLRLSEGTEGGP